jgi:hypothetical protein
LRIQFQCKTNLYEERKTWQKKKKGEEATPTEESKGKSSWMDNTTLIVFVGVILFGMVLWFSSDIYLGLAIFALTLFFGKSVLRRFR